MIQDSKALMLAKKMNKTYEEACAILKIKPTGLGKRAAPEQIVAQEPKRVKFAEVEEIKDEPIGEEELFGALTESEPEDREQLQMYFDLAH